MTEFTSCDKCRQFTPGDHGQCVKFCINNPKNEDLFDLKQKDPAEDWDVVWRPHADDRKPAVIFTETHPHIFVMAKTNMYFPDSPRGRALAEAYQRYWPVVLEMMADEVVKGLVFSAYLTGCDSGSGTPKSNAAKWFNSGMRMTVEEVEG